MNIYRPGSSRLCNGSRGRCVPRLFFKPPTDLPGFRTYSFKSLWSHRPTAVMIFLARSVTALRCPQRARRLQLRGVQWQPCSVRPGRSPSRVSGVGCPHVPTHACARVHGCVRVHASQPSHLSHSGKPPLWWHQGHTSSCWELACPAQAQKATQTGTGCNLRGIRMQSRPFPSDCLRILRTICWCKPTGWPLE